MTGFRASGERAAAGLWQQQQQQQQQQQEPRDPCDVASKTSCLLSPPRRAVLRRDASSSTGSVIQFDNSTESIWWAKFLGFSSDETKASDLKDSVSLRDLFQALGADPDDDSIASIRLTPGLQSRVPCCFLPA